MQEALNYIAGYSDSNDFIITRQKDLEVLREIKRFLK